ncbi:MAG: caspase family protein [Planctomycetota bacterium]
MRVRSLGLMLVAAVAAGGCATRIFQPASPTLAGLERGDVHVSKVQGTEDSDVYKITYVANVPAEVAWETAMEMPQWLQSNRMVGEFAPLATGGGRGGGTGEVEQRYLVRWRDSTLQELVLRRDDARKLIDIAIVPHNGADRQWGHCTVMMGPYRRNSAIIEAEVSVSWTFGSRLTNLLLTPAHLITGPKVENDLQALWEDLALAHREASERALELAAPASGRTHIIAVGAESFEAAGAWGQLAYSEDDAAAFFDWASQANPALPGDQNTLIRTLLVGPEATSEISDPGREAVVQPGDTILFFYAGHIELEEDVLAARGRRGAAKYGYLVTANADPENLRFTAIKRDDVLDALRYSEATRCVLFCDACYSGGRRVRSVDGLPRGVRTRGREAPDPGFQHVGTTPGAEGAARAKTGILAAARPFSLAAESDELRHGLFTHALLEGLGGAADDDANGYVSLAELSSYIEMKVPELSGAQQMPYVSVPPSEGLGSLRWPVQPSG